MQKYSLLLIALLHLQVAPYVLFPFSVFDKATILLRFDLCIFFR